MRDSLRAVVATVSITIACASLSATDLAGQSRQTANTLKLDGPATSPAATIADVAWIAGSWSGDALGGRAEEVWSAPRDGAMMGMYRLLKDGEVVFYELLTITEEEESLMLRLKHFGPQLSGWEEKDEAVTFPLVRADEGAAYFDGMTFRRDTPNRMRVYVASDQSDGTVAELEFHYRREGRP